MPVKSLLLWLLSLMAMAAPAYALETLVVVVRHAEKATDDPKDPSLSVPGQSRARALAEALHGIELKAIYATQFRRTQLTAAPSASAAKVEVQIVSATAAVEADASALAQLIQKKHSGQAVLVVGHSNTVPALVRALSGKTVTPIAEDEFDHLFLISVDDENHSRLLQARYGAAH